MALLRFRRGLSNALNAFWYRGYWGHILWPFALIFQSATYFRRLYLQRFRRQTVTTPLIVVGNLSVGGVGKTPLVMALAQQLHGSGLRVGIVTRGYGSKPPYYPYEVRHNDTSFQVGDEPLLIARKTNCPVVIARKRMQAVHYLLAEHRCQVIISDDGLQHYAMPRTIEIVVIDGVRGLGNGLCLPAGPLRENKKRLTEADFIVINGGNGLFLENCDVNKIHAMTLEPKSVMNLATMEALPIKQLPMPVAAVAAIGHPQRFFATLQQLGILFNPYSFPDHYPFQSSDLIVKESAVLMTEKDAIKCRDFTADNLYFLPVEVSMEKRFWNALLSHPSLQASLQLNSAALSTVRAETDDKAENL